MATPTAKILVIDDLRVFHELEGAVYARNSTAAVGLLAGGDPWEQVWFDHDLGALDDIKPVLGFLELRHFHGAPVRIDKCFVHTSNPAGAAMLVRSLEKMYPVQRVYAGGPTVGTIHD